MATRKNTVKIDHLTYIRPDTRQMICENFSLDIHEGEIVAVLGPSGCGKSTLADLIAGYLQPHKGAIRFEGAQHRSPGRHCIVIHQASDIFEWLTVEENIRLVCPDTKTAQRYLELVGLGDATRVQGFALSGGMKKRLSYARALSVNPSFLILDEAFSSLDYTLRHKLYMDLLTISRDEKKTMLLITHDIEEAAVIADRILVFSDKPFTITKEVNVKLMRDRHTNFKHSPRFYQLIDELKEALHTGS